jgi:nucleotide-binding universal stress UspA family protein
MNAVGSDEATAATRTIRRRGERIAVGVDGSINSRAAVRWAVDHARPGDTVVLVHIWARRPAASGPDLGTLSDEDAAGHCAEHERAHAECLPRAQGTTVSCEAVEGDPRHVLASFDCDLLVVGARRRGGLADHVLGSVTAAVIGHCRRPVVVVPHEQP